MLDSCCLLPIISCVWICITYLFELSAYSSNYPIEIPSMNVPRESITAYIWLVYILPHCMLVIVSPYHLSRIPIQNFLNSTNYAHIIVKKGRRHTCQYDWHMMAAFHYILPLGLLNISCLKRRQCSYHNCMLAISFSPLQMLYDWVV